MSKPLAWVKNISGPHHHRTGLQTPVGSTVPIYKADDLELFQGRVGECYVVMGADALASADGPAGPVTVEAGADGIEPDLLTTVIVHGEVEEASEAQLALADGRVMPLQGLLRSLTAAGQADFKSGWITLFPGTDSELKFKGYARLIEELRADPALFYPPNPAERPPKGHSG